MPRPSMLFIGMPLCILLLWLSFERGTWWFIASIIAVLATTAAFRALILAPNARADAEQAARAAALESTLASEQAAAQRIGALLETVPEPVLATDERGIVQTANAAARALFESLGADPRRAIDDLFTQSDVLALVARAAEGDPGQVQVRLFRDGAIRVYEALATPAASTPASRRGVVIVLRDVTEPALAAQLKTDFVANASHELRTPLASIRLAMETLRDDPTLVDRLSTVVLNNTARLEDLVRDLLDLSRVESPDVQPAREPIDLRDIAQNLIPMFEDVCRERRLTLAADIAPDAATLIGDPRLTELVLKNLVENATKYAFEGTTIRIHASRDPDAPRAIRIRVADRGMGIPIAHQQRIFERFYQVDAARSGNPARRGTGLGLAIVKHALKRLGGSIAVESVWQQGTTMIVELPAE